MIARQRMWRNALLFAFLLGIVRLLLHPQFPNFLGVSWELASAVSTIPASPAAPVATVAKLTAAQVEQQLRLAPVSRGAPRNHTCLPGEKGWDYVCAYSAADPTVIRMKIGVRVGPTEIVEASMPYPVYASLPPATGL